MPSSSRSFRLPPPPSLQRLSHCLAIDLGDGGCGATSVDTQIERDDGPPRSDLVVARFTGKGDDEVAQPLSGDLAIAAALFGPFSPPTRFRQRRVAALFLGGDALPPKRFGRRCVAASIYIYIY
ncbi:UNVERIFIED_CONTAM: hypothetical protein Slati_1012100 [Sesamum latifolium]|uniref:Uncharacterized protein n=1 Tax=Sesamum latifolium TaxID=2727402 RepID=A0AAW2XS22_9LAMI